LKVTLLSEEAEIQFVALRNINLILQKRPDILALEIRIFFTKYNDPLYVKLEKLEVIIKLCSERNIDQVKMSNLTTRFYLSFESMRMKLMWNLYERVFELLDDVPSR
jgi:vesicle coat complex subunit